MRKPRKSAKDKVRDLKRVLEHGIEAINEGILEPITAMFILPGNGTDQEPKDGILEVSRGGTRQISYEEYRQQSVRVDVGVGQDRQSVTVTATRTTEITYVQEKPEPLPAPEHQVRRSDPKKQITQAPGPTSHEQPAKPKATKGGFDIDEFMENAIDAEEIAKFNYQVGQRLIRPIRWR